MPNVVVIGAGLGGLAAAISLAASGRQVLILEALPEVGGKAGVAEVNGVRFDTGPSVLTLPHVFDELLQRAGTRLADEVELLQPEPFVRYLLDDEPPLDFSHSLEQTLENVGRNLGSDARDDLYSFTKYAQTIWDIAAPPFVYGPAPSVSRVFSFGPSYWAQLPKIDASRSMWAAITQKVRDPRLRAILARFATYNGSDARKAPATLNCIAHVEITLGGYGIKGGVAAVVQALQRVALAQGVTIRTQAPVERIDLKRQRVRGVVLATGEHIPCEKVVVNADVGHLLSQLVDKPIRGIAPITQPSMSGWTAVFAAKANPRRAAHTVVLSNPYIREFEDIFDKGLPPSTPTAYLCDQSLAHGREGWGDRVPVFVMGNTPAEPPGGSPTSQWESLREGLHARSLHAGALKPADELVWERSPADLARLFPGTRGAIYGAASHGMLSSFRRPANAIPAVKGLYLASGSAHPGGGMPLAVLSGCAAANAILGR
jgi:1-hydroxycarotenoid 3,4-desaturase